MALTGIAFYSYALASAAFLLLGMLVAVRWKAIAGARAIAFGAFATCVWAAILAWQVAQGRGPNPLALGVEVVRTAAWSAWLLLLHRPATRATVWAIAGGVYLCCLLALAVLDRPAMVLHTAMAVVGIVLVEQLYRHRPPQARWALKFACLGVGTLFVYDFYMYSNAMLFRRIDPAIWAARGAVNALAVPLIVLSIGRSGSWMSGLAISRRAMFHSAALFGSAAYLLAMGAAGYYLRLVGGTWGAVLQAVFLCGALMLLATVLFSGTFRAWMRVFIGKHFYRYHYDYRDEWLRVTSTLSQAGPDLGVRVVQALGGLVESPGGVLFTRRTRDRFAAAAFWHQPASNVIEPAGSAFIELLEGRRWVLELDECGSDALPAWLGHFPRSWLAVPLLLHERLAGFVVLARPRSAMTMDWEVRDVLKVAGSQAASYLAQREVADALMVARQFESFNRMSAFVVHDLKNLVSQLSLIVTNAEVHSANPEFQSDVLETVAQSAGKMKAMLLKLSCAESGVHVRPLVLDDVLFAAVVMRDGAVPRPVLDTTDPGLQVLADRERLERVMGHLIQNAIEATPRDGKVHVGLKRCGNEAVVTVTDTGTGMAADFIRERLFRPFDSTKDAGMGIGVFESREYIAELGGTVDVDSVPGGGTTFTVTLPLIAPAGIER